MLCCIAVSNVISLLPLCYCRWWHEWLSAPVISGTIIQKSFWKWNFKAEVSCTWKLFSSLVSKNIFQIWCLFVQVFCPIYPFELLYHMPAVASLLWSTLHLKSQLSELVKWHPSNHPSIFWTAYPINNRSLKPIPMDLGHKVVRL